MMFSSTYMPIGGLATFAILHMIAAVFTVIGIALLIVWAAKYLSKNALKNWGAGLLVFGIIACVLIWSTVGTVHDGSGRYDCGMMRDGKMQMHTGMMNGDMMMSDDTDGMDMSMHDMETMLQGLEGDDFDKAFIEMMIPHHQGAIEMAKAARTSANHQEIKDMAEAIIAAQQTEIDQMHAWQKSWGFAE